MKQSPYKKSEDIKPGEHTEDIDVNKSSKTESMEEQLERVTLLAIKSLNQLSNIEKK
ncbi:hypothetical protein [Photobacterium proteolyticum]|uniref:hypothetical protein n=1 Tax=Photobacterium proteolyticum TaxID=1903952 RepID=UPI000A4A4306|nr:hypothetical protein [Photobacterium proteolyticum]